MKAIEYRSALIEAYAERIVDGMDMKELVQLAHETICERLEDYTDADLEDEIAEFYPDLLDAE
jgi:methionine aminopeptidase